MVDPKIRAVPRPPNTVVVDTGHNGPRRYAVRERAGYKTTSGNNSGPRNGKVIGYICNSSFIAKADLVATASPRPVYFKRYGAAALIHNICKDLYEDLLKAFNHEDANRLMTIAYLRITLPRVYDINYEDKAYISYISDLYPCKGLANDDIPTLLTQLGTNTETLVHFNALRMTRVISKSNIIIDGTIKVKSTESHCNEAFQRLEQMLFELYSLHEPKLLAPEECSVIYAYDPHVSEVLCANCIKRNALNAKNFRDFLTCNQINSGIIICDKNLNAIDFKDILDENPDLHYIELLKKSDSHIKEHSMLRCDRITTTVKGNLVLYKKVTLDNGQVLNTIKACKKGYTVQLEDVYESLANNSSAVVDDYIDSKAVRRTIAFISDVDLDPLLVLNHFDRRPHFTKVFDHFNDPRDPDKSTPPSKAHYKGNEFINSLVSIIRSKIINAFKKVEAEYGKIPWSVRSSLEELRDILRDTSGPFKGDIADRFWNSLPTRNSTYSLLVELGLAEDSTGTIARKKLACAAHPSPASTNKRKDRPCSH